jgi:hypothetical protein
MPLFCFKLMQLAIITTVGRCNVVVSPYQANAAAAAAGFWK